MKILLSRKSRLKLLSLLAFILLLNNNSFAQYNINALSTNYTTGFNTLTSGTWTDNTTVTGWYTKTDATSSIVTYGANTGSTTTAGLYAFGVAGTNALSDRALGFAPTNTYTGASGTGKGYIGWRLKNNTGSTITSITITYSGEQWRRDNASSQNLTVEYQTATSVTNINAGSWTSIPALTFTSPQLSATALALDGNAVANRSSGITTTISVTVNNGDEIMIRWSDLNDSGNDHFLAIDDITINASGGAPTNSITTGAITGTPFSVTCTAGSTGTVSFTSSGTFTGNTYTAQLSNSSGSFTLASNIGTLVSDANTGTINISIPAGLPTGAGYLIRVISDAPYAAGSNSSTFTITLTGGACSALQIESILVDACGVNEGENEMVLFQVGASAMNTSNLTANWPSNSWLGVCQNATTSATVAAINATIAGGGHLVEPTGGVLPANTQVLFFTSTAFNYGLFDFTSLNSTLYVVFQCAGNTAGHFKNHGSGYLPRTLTVTFTGSGSDVVTYDAGMVYNGDGGEVDFDTPGNPTYPTTSGCKAPLTPLPIELINFNVKYLNRLAKITWTTASEINNNYFTIERSIDAINFDELKKTPGAGNSVLTINYSTEDESPLMGINYYRLKQTDFDGNSSYSNIVSIDVENDDGFQIINSFNSIENSSLIVTVNCGINCLVNFELYDMTGRKVFSSNENFTGNNKNVSISTNHLSTGIYILKVYNGEKMISKKIKL